MALSDSRWRPPALLLDLCIAHGSPPITQIAFPTCRAHYPGGPHRYRSVVPCRRGLPCFSGRSASTTSLSRPAQASLALRPAGLLVPLWDFVTRLRPKQLPIPAARQLPCLPTSTWVGPSPTGDLRRWGALRNAGYIARFGKIPKHQPLIPACFVMP